MVRRIGAKSAARVDVRLVSATNIDLSHGESRREFRKDLFWRLNVIEIHAPPLHARGDDVIEIAEHFIAAHENPAFRSSRLSASAAARLRSHAFPGNFRELRNRIRRALLHARGGEIDGDMLGLDATQTAGTALTVDEAQALVAQFLVADALVKASGDPTAAGVLIGRAKSFVYAAMKAFDNENPAAARRRLLAELKSRFS
jgi:DNA-binding NtrC family response regulator